MVVISLMSSLLRRVRRFLSRFVYSVVFAALSVLLVACVSGGGGGGSSSSTSGPAGRVGLFSHASYNFVMLNTTLSDSNNATLDNRTLGLIDVEEAEVRALLPEGAVWDPDDVRYTRYTIVGGANDLTQAFFRLDHGNSARLLFQAAPRYAQRNFTLDYVVNTLGVKALRVEANISYIDRNGNRQTLISPLPVVPVTIRAVAEVPAANAFLAFDGIRRSDTETRTTTTPGTSEVNFNGRLSETTNTTMTKQLSPFTTTWRTANYTADTDEPTPAAALDLTQLLANNQVAQDLDVAVTLTLDNDSAQQVSSTYPITANANRNLSIVNGNSSVDGSFLTFLKNLNTTGTRSEGLSDSDFVAVDDNDNVGPNVTEVAWSFTFAYTVEVTTTRTSTRFVDVRSVAYTAEGRINENAAGRTSLRGPAEVLRTLGISIKRPDGFAGPLPTLYFRVANANATSQAHCATAFYLDQGYRNYRNYQIKAQASLDAANPLLDHETEDRYDCQLQASLTGTNYRNITTDIETDLDNQTTAVSGTAVDLNVANCGATNATTRLQALRTAPGCIYQAGLDIAVNDVNEPVTLDFDRAGAARGEANLGLAGDHPYVVGPPLNTSDAAALELATFTYVEQDEDANGTVLGVDVPLIATVAPAMVTPMGGNGPVATANLFYIERVASANNTARLMLNASAAGNVLDYEALTANATGQREYRVTIRATDNSPAALITDQVFNLEVEDVVYAPVAFTYTPADDVNHIDDPLTQTLLPGFAQFVANGGPVLGQLSARDPESNSSAGISYEYLGVTPLSSDPSWSSSFVLGRNPARAVADELLLVGLGLRDGANFNVSLRAINESPRANVTSAMLPVRTMVDYAATNVTNTTYHGEPAIKFNAGGFLGFVAEGESGAVVRNSSSLPSTNIDDLLVPPADDNRSFFLMTGEEIARLLPALGALGPDVQRVFAGRLAALSGPAQFNLSNTTGALSLRGAADFTTQPVYTLLLRVANTTGEMPIDLLRSDYAALQVVVEDTNTAPAIMALTARHDAISVGADSVSINALPENTPAGTVLATLSVQDDNPLTDLNFVPAEGATAYQIERTQDSQRVAATADERAHYVASYRLVTVAPDYEANRTLDISHQLHDNGQYRYDPLQQQVFRFNPRVMINSTTLGVNGSIENVNEAPALRFAADAVDLMENAAQNTPVVMVTAMDPEGMAANLTYTLTTNPSSLASAFNVGNVSATSTNVDGREATWTLTVADAAALENAGDGQIFTLTLTATDPGGESASESMAITVIDTQQLNPDAVNRTLVTLSEQEALDNPNRVLRAPLFRFVDVQTDYDEYFFGLGPNTPNPVRFGEVNFEAGAIDYVTPAGAPNMAVTDGLRDEERFNLVTLTANGAAVDLVLGEAGLIEPNLLGNNFTVDVQLTDPAGAGTPVMAEVPVAILPTNPEGWRFADANADDTAAPFVPAAYNFRYTQTNYADGGVPCLVGNQTYVRIDEQCYATVQVREDAEGDSVLYAARDRANQQELVAPDTVNASDSGFGVLVTNDINVRGLDLAAITIYSLDDQGNLQAAGDDFGTYFNYTVNTNYGAANRTALVIRQRMHAVLYANGSVNPNARYAALDTLPLDSAEGNQNRVLKYFFVAEDGENNASRRAIAQVNFDVRTAGLNEQVIVTELRLGTLDLRSGISVPENGVNQDGTPFTDFPLNLVNNPREVLTLTIQNPDGAARNQTVNATIDIVATGADVGSTSSGDLTAAAGTASGNQLVRLGSAANANRSLNIASGSVMNTTTLPFQLARNVYGTAFIRVRFEERDAGGTLVEDPYYQWFEIRITNVDEAPSTISTLLVGGEGTSAMEDELGGANPELNLTLTNGQFAEPRNLDISVTQVSAANLAYASLNVNGSSPVQVVAGSDADTKYVLQDLVYDMHAHGTTTFTLMTSSSEPRGFADQVHRYPSRTLPSATFRVESVNDPLTNVSTRGSTLAGYSLLANFGGLGDSDRRGQFVESSSDAILHFSDVDLSTGGDIPVNPRITLPSQPLGNSSTMIGSSDFQMPDLADIDIDRVGSTNDIRVEFPVELRLSQAQYEAISGQDEGVDLNLTVTLTDGGGDNVMATANLELISIAVSTDDATTPIISGGYNEGTIRVAEETPDETDLSFAEINITDPGVRRGSGDTFTYTVRLTPTNNLLEWRDIDNRNVNSRFLSSRDSASFLSALRLAKVPQDVDVGSYTVEWSIDEARSAAGSSREVANGTFTLNITNVNDPIAAAAAPLPDTSNAQYNLQTDFGVHTDADRGPQITTGKVVTVYFTDDDLRLPGQARDNAIPEMGDISVTSTAMIDGASVEVTIEGGSTAVSVSEYTDSNDGSPSHIQVEVPIRLELTAAQYDDINSRNAASSIDIMVTAQDRNTTGSASATVPVSLTIESGTNVFELSQRIANNTEIEIPTGLTAGTQTQLPAFTIHDPEIQRAGGEEITYSLTVTPSSPSILAWSEGLNENISGQSTDTVDRFLQTIPSVLNDADHAGRYTVTWSIADGEGTETGDFRLNVTDQNDPLTLVSVQNVTEVLMRDDITRDLIFIFNDPDLSTAENSRDTTGASIANVVGLSSSVMASVPSVNSIGLASNDITITSIERVGATNRIRVTITVPIAVDQTEFNAISALGGVTIPITIQRNDYDVYGRTGGRSAVTAIGSITLSDPGNAAEASVPSNTYEGGTVTIYREQVLVGTRDGADAVFVNGSDNNNPVTININDDDINSTGTGDTYTYDIRRVLRDGQPVSVTGLLEWDESSLRVVADGVAENHIRFDSSLSSPEPQPGTYSVTWGITEARDPGSDGVANGNGTFTLIVLETPEPDIRNLTARELPLEFEGSASGVAANITLLSGVPGDVVMNVSSPTLNNELYFFGELGGGISIPLTSRYMNTTAINASIRVRGDFNDKDVRNHNIIVTASTTDYDGMLQTKTVIFQLTVNNTPEPTDVIPAADLTESSLTDAGVIILANFTLSDEDLNLPTSSAPTSLTSNLIVNFSAAGVTATGCEISRGLRETSEVTTDDSKATYAGLELDLADCAVPLHNNLFDLSQIRRVELTGVAINDYLDPVGDEGTVELDIATGSYRVPVLGPRLSVVSDMMGIPGNASHTNVTAVQDDGSQIWSHLNTTEEESDTDTTSTSTLSWNVSVWMNNTFPTDEANTAENRIGWLASVNSGRGYVLRLFTSNLSYFRFSGININVDHSDYDGDNPEETVTLSAETCVFGTGQNLDNDTRFSSAANLTVYRDADGPKCPEEGFIDERGVHHDGVNSTHAGISLIDRRNGHHSLITDNNQLNVTLDGDIDFIEFDQVEITSEADGAGIRVHIQPASDMIGVLPSGDPVTRDVLIVLIARDESGREDRIGILARIRYH